MTRRSWGALLTAWAVAMLALLPLVGLGVGALGPRSGMLGGADPTGVPWRGLAPLVGATLLLAVAVTVLSLVLGIALAWLEQRARLPGGRVLAMLALLPLAVPSYLLAGTLRQALGPGGWIGGLLGLPSFTGIGPAVLVLTLACAPYVQALVGAALLRLSVEEEDAARSLGRTPLGSFVAVVLPRLRPALVLSGLLAGLYVVGDFGAVAVLDCPVLTWRIYQAYGTQDLPRAAVLGLSALAVVAPLLVLGPVLERGGLLARPGVPNPRRPARTPVRWPFALGGYVLLVSVVALGLAVPVGTLVGWVWRGWQLGAPFASLGRPLLHTVVLGGVGSIVVVLLAMTPAWVSARTARSRGLDQAMFVSGALPGILVATGLLLVALMPEHHGWRGIYFGLRQSGVLLFAGYGLRYLSQGFAGLKSAFRRLDPRQEECARSLGAGAWTRVRRVALPAVAPGATATALLLFLVLVKELPITLMLQPLGVRTLAFRVFDRYQEAFLHDAGLSGMALLAVALGGQAALARWRHHA
jgi:iron(III) transport system permease protein